MVQDVANCIPATSAYARVHALVANASSVLSAVIVQDTLRATAGVRIALIVC